MAYLSDQEKVEKGLRLLMSLNHPLVWAQMQLRGFDDEERLGGWARLDRAAGRFRAARRGAVTSTTGPLVEAADQWENVWLDVIDATLRRTFPELRDRILAGITKTEGLPVILNVRTVVQRIDEIRAEGDETNAKGLALLAKRGLDETQLAAARAIVAQAETGTPVVPLDPDPAEVEERQAALDDLWAWYQDWTKLARTVIRSRNLLVHMGLAEPTRRAPAEAPTETPVPEPV